jgi:branched-chain amino acid transport system permease protein
MLTQLVISGLVTGSLYALLALGLVLIYKTSHVLNFAHGEIAMVNTFLAFTILTTLHVPFLWAAALAVASSFALGALIEVTFLRPARTTNVLGLVIITLGVQQILYGSAGWIWGYDTKTFPTPLSEHRLYRVGDAVISEVGLWIVAVSVALMCALLLFFRYTRVGTAMRAVAQNPITARLMGVRAPWVVSLAWGLASILSAVAGILVAPLTFLDPNMMMSPLLKAFAAATLGGMHSLAGAVVGGGTLGILENLVGAYLTPQLKDTVAFLVIVVVLCVKPSGMIGRHYHRRV